MKHTPFTTRAFTLVETLIAIAILMIAVAGPLVVASKGLTAALYARDQMTAAYLAQETMEVVKNIRDNNLIRPSPWLYDIETCLSSDNSCDASAIPTDGNNVELSCNADAGCQIYYSNADGYSRTSGGQETLFRRYFYLIESPPGKQVKVVVKWNHGLTPNELTLSSELVNSLR